MSEEADYILDIEGISDEETTTSHLSERPWIGIRFDCCHVYSRVYRNRDGTAYTGRCPQCLREFNVRVGSGGTDNRFFRAE